MAVAAELNVPSVRARWCWHAGMRDTWDHVAVLAPRTFLAWRNLSM